MGRGPYNYQTKQDRPVDYGTVMECPVIDTPVTLIGHTTKRGILTGRSRGDEWQCYWTTNDGGVDNVSQWVHKSQLIIGQWEV